MLPGPFRRSIRRLICDLFDEGASASAIARYLGTTRDRVRQVLLRNGTAVTDTIYVDEVGSSNTGKTVNFGNGFHFPAGGYVDVDSNVTSVIVSYDEVLV